MERHRCSLRAVALCTVLTSACAGTTYPNLSARVAMTRELQPDRRLQATLCADLAQGEAARRARYGRASWWLAGGAAAGAVVTTAAAAGDREILAWSAGIGSGLLLLGALINLGLYSGEDDGRGRAQHSLDLVQASLNEERRSRLSQSLRKLEQEIAAGGMNPAELDAAAAWLRERLTAFQRDLDATHSAIETAESRIAERKAEIVKRDMELSQLRATKKSKTRDAAIATGEQAIDQANATVRDLARRIADLRTTAAPLGRALEQTEESLRQAASFALRHQAAEADLAALGNPTSLANDAYVACVGAGN